MIDRDEREAMRRKVSSTLGVKVPRTVFDEVYEDDLDMARDYDEFAYNKLEEEVLRLLELHKKWAPRDGMVRSRRREAVSGQENVGPLLTTPERRRSTVLSDLFSSLAERLDPVEEFRRSYLPDGVLDDEEAWKFLNQPAYRYLSRDQIEWAGLPLSGIRSRVLEDRMGLQKTPDGWQFELWTLCVECRAGTKTHREQVRVPLFDALNKPLKILRWQSKEPTAKQITVLPGSVLDDLRRLAEFVAWCYWWPKPRASWFLLTGVAPPSPAIHVDTSRRAGPEVTQGRITLTIAPWVSAKSVAKVYAERQKWMLGRKNRAIGPRLLDQFAFCEARRPAGGKEGPTWRALCKEWRSRKRMKSSPSAWRNFQRDYSRVRMSLVHPTYAMGEPLGPILRWGALFRRLESTSDPKKRQALTAEMMKMK